MVPSEHRQPAADPSLLAMLGDLGDTRDEGNQGNLGDPAPGRSV